MDAAPWSAAAATDLTGEPWIAREPLIHAV